MNRFVVAVVFDPHDCPSHESLQMIAERGCDRLEPTLR
jgi:hypothetical protein